MLCRVTAAGRSSRGTISGMIACQGGPLRAAPRPSRKVKKRRPPGGDAARAAVITPSAEGGDGHPDLGDQEDAPAVEHVGEGAGRQREQEHRQAGRRLHERHQARPRTASVVIMPRRADALEPGADVRGDAGDPQPAEERNAGAGSRGTRVGVARWPRWSSRATVYRVGPGAYGPRWHPWQTIPLGDDRRCGGSLLGSASA